MYDAYTLHSKEDELQYMTLSLWADPIFFPGGVVSQNFEGYLCSLDCNLSYYMTYRQTIFCLRNTS